MYSDNYQNISPFPTTPVNFSQQIYNSQQQMQPPPYPQTMFQLPQQMQPQFFPPPQDQPQQQLEPIKIRAVPAAPDVLNASNFTTIENFMKSSFNEVYSAVTSLPKYRNIPQDTVKDFLLSELFQELYFKSTVRNLANTGGSEAAPSSQHQPTDSTTRTNPPVTIDQSKDKENDLEAMRQRFRELGPIEL